MKNLLSIFFLIFSYFNCISQNEDSINLYSTWNNADNNNLKWQINYFQDSFYLKKVQKEIDYVKENINNHQDYSYSRKYFIEFVGSGFFKDDLIVIERKNIHEDRIYTISKNYTCHYITRNGKWELYKRLTTKPFDMENISQCMRVIERRLLSDKSQLTIGETLIFSKFSKCEVTVRHLFTICEEHLECLSKLFIR